MIETDFRTNFEIGDLGQMGIGHPEISEFEGVNLDDLQREITGKLKHRREQMEDYLHSYGIVIDRKAIHEEIESIMGMDKDALNALEKEVKAKLEQKRIELDQLKAR